MDGTVRDAKVVSNEMDDEAGVCICAVVSELEFDPPSAGVCIINYPFVLNAPNDD